jgi:hypothetical protein
MSSATGLFLRVTLPLAVFNLVAATGFALFALSDALAGFALARVILGVGVSAGLMAILNFAYLGLWAGPWLRDVVGYDGPARWR